MFVFFAIASIAIASPIAAQIMVVSTCALGMYSCIN